MNTHSLVSIEDYSKEEILEVLKLASEFEANPNQRLLEGKVVASLFFEPSTRTRLSFETAINRLGGRIIGFTGKFGYLYGRGFEIRTDGTFFITSYESFPSDVPFCRS